MNPDKLLTLLMGRCWHEWIQVKNRESGNLPFEHLCLCGHSALSNRETLHVVCSPNPSYSDPRHRDEFFSWLCRERGEMFYEFTFWAYTRKCPLPDKDAYYVWLFFQSPSRPRDLMAEWLMLDETVERFGWVKCPNCEGDKRITLSDGRGSHDCSLCNGSGKVFAPWAKYAKEGK